MNYHIVNLFFPFKTRVCYCYSLVIGMSPIVAHGYVQRTWEKV